jgi:L-ascorbate metabolism protein UlaG (beta-lactamase superfamily)
VGHTHIDHALDIPSIARRTQAPIFGSASLDALLGRADLPQRVSAVRPSDCRALPGMGNLAVYAGAHGGVLFGRPPLPGEVARTGPYPLRAREYQSGAVMVFDLTIAGRRLVHVGSAGLPRGPLPEGPCDALFLCVPGWRAQPDYPAVFLQRLQPRRIVPIHFDHMTRPLDDPRVQQPDSLVSRLLNLSGFLARLRSLAPGTPVLLPRLWEPVPF